MTDIFISYAREDRPRIEPLAKSLEGLGWSVFWDRTIPAGKTWRQVIGDALKNARSVIVAWSQESIKSEWVIEEADRGRIRSILIPILIDDVNPPLGFGTIQAADLTIWDPAQSSSEFDKFIADISIILGPPPKHVKDAERKAERERKRQQEEEKRKAEKEIETRRKADEERKRKEAEEENRRKEGEAKRNAEEDRKRKEVKVEIKPARPEPPKPTPSIKRPAEKSPATKISIVIALFVVIVAGLVLLFWQEPQKSITESPPTVAKQEQTVATKPSVTIPLKRFTNTIGMEFVLIPAGRFKMGSGISPEEVVRRYGGKAEWFKDEHPQDDVKISHPFYLQTTEVTVGQWRRFAKETGYETKAETGGGAYVWEGSNWVKKEGTYWDNPLFSQDDHHPVTCVSWNDIQEFVQWLNRIDGKNVHRLPTEAEWEYACRAETTTEFSFGDDVQRLSEYGWYLGNSNRKTHAVAQRKANEWNLFDMHGNVWEWVADDYHNNYGKAPDDGKAWTDDPRGTNRVVRGGGWSSVAPLCRSASREFAVPGYCVTDVGFRLARSVTLGP